MAKRSRRLLNIGLATAKSATEAYNAVCDAFEAPA
jgi:hypothetical protein